MQWNAFLPHIRHLQQDDQALIHKAFDLCIRAHTGQLRKSGDPYSSHPIAVAAILADMHADKDTVIAALLHDVLEDTSITGADLMPQFGQATVNLIEGVTKLDNEEIRAHPTLDEEIESLRKMITAMQKDVRLMVIKLADRLHNMRTVGFLSQKRQEEFSRETLDIYVKIADRLSMQDFRDELEGLCLQTLEPATFAQLLEQRRQNEKLGQTVIASMRTTLAGMPHPLPATSEILFENKTWNHLKSRLLTTASTVGKRSKLTTVLLCDSVPECYVILGILHQHWPHEILSFKDFISAPATNGYRGLHTTVILPRGVRIRCKIRTREMHTYA
ncbi:MAG: HD domain-containing protein, partial [Candidatus Peribacteraceae bacterium]|nr:HD domain-containing protein [Candidatus Peribacteraceae bacterium]